MQPFSLLPFHEDCLLLFDSFILKFERGGVATPVTPFLDPPMFEGYAGGSWWNDPGAASKYVCLPPDPDLVSRSYPSYYATMHGGPNTMKQLTPMIMAMTYRALFAVAPRERAF